jgi:hypothetical protein
VRNLDEHRDCILAPRLRRAPRRKNAPAARRASLKLVRRRSPFLSGW